MQASEIVKSYRFDYDRTMGGTLTLPYNYNEIAIPINEISYHGTINEVYNKLQTNLMYLYSLTKLSDNNIPFNYAKIASGTPTLLYALSGAFNWIPTSLTSTTNSKPLSSYGLGQLDQLVSGKFTNKAPFNTTSKLGIFSSSTHLYVLTSTYNNNTIGAFLSTNKVTENSTFTFSNINSILIDEQKEYLYVCDSGNNTIYQYNISNLFDEDSIIGRKIVYVDSMGGTGGYQDADKFNNPGFLNLYNNNLFVIDKGNYCIKVYDSNMNWVDTYRNKKLFLDNEVTAFKINEDNNKFYFGFNTILGVFTDQLSTCNFFSMSSFFVSGEKIVDFSFSTVDKNVFYVITNKNVYKKFISKPETFIGKFLLGINNITTTQFNFSYINNYDDDQDNLVVYGKRYNAGMFLSFLEKSNYITILTNNDLDFYTIDEIKVHPEEYSQDWVFSKANYKILLNILAMRDRITKRFTGKYDGNGNLLFFGTLYLQDNEVQKEKFDYSLNYLMSINEMYSNSVFNRSIQKMYDLQTHMLSVLRDSKLNTWPPLTSTKVIS